MDWELYCCDGVPVIYALFPALYPYTRVLQPVPAKHVERGRILRCLLRFLVDGADLGKVCGPARAQKGTVTVIRRNGYHGHPHGTGHKRL